METNFKHPENLFLKSECISLVRTNKTQIHAQTFGYFEVQ